ncbi:MAG TPA: hypothetical protein VNA17_03515 [Pyrinomonadaceae bacterium]|nr:hypothetical protein [Pyrinomonadaceae bacterium]
MKLRLFLVLTLVGAMFAVAQQPFPTPTLYSARTLIELEKLQKAALDSNYA